MIQKSWKSARGVQVPTWSQWRTAAKAVLCPAAMFLLVSCSKVAPPETAESTPPPPAEVPKQTVQVHPAQGAREAAMRMYPDLALKNSTFNKTFVDLFEEMRKKNPDLLTRADWPLLLARRTADMLSVGMATPTPPPPPPVVVVPPSPTPNALERGAYNQKRITSPYATPWIRYTP